MIDYSVLDGNNKLPIINGVFLDGRIYKYSIESIYDAERKRSRRCAVYTGQLDNTNDKNVSSLIVTYEKSYNGQELLLECGEGSWGGDGFICLSKANRNIIFLAFFDTANPFVIAEYKGKRIRAMNNLGELWTFCFDAKEPPSIEISEEDPVNMESWENRDKW